MTLKHTGIKLVHVVLRVQTEYLDQFSLRMYLFLKKCAADTQSISPTANRWRMCV